MIVDDAEPGDDGADAFARSGALDTPDAMAEGTGSGELPTAFGSLDPDRPHHDAPETDPADEPSLVAWDPDAILGGAALSASIVNVTVTVNVNADLRAPIPADIGLEPLRPPFGAPAVTNTPALSTPSAADDDAPHDRKSSARFALAEEHRRKRTRR